MGTFRNNIKSGSITCVYAIQSRDMYKTCMCSIAAGLSVAPIPCPFPSLSLSLSFLITSQQVIVVILLAAAALAHQLKPCPIYNLVSSVSSS